MIMGNPPLSPFTKGGAKSQVAHFTPLFLKEGLGEITQINILS
jgi:hypothetical protein